MLTGMFFVFLLPCDAVRAQSQPSETSLFAIAAQPKPVDEESALPPAEGVNTRAPGLQLPPDATFAAPPGGQAAQGPSREELEAQIRSQSFDAAVTGLLPLKPEEIKEMLRQYDAVQEAVETPPYDYPTPEVVVQTVALDPGTTPPVVKLAVNHVSTLNVMDATGAPWPIQDISWAGNFDIVQPEEGANIIRMIPMTEFARGNMSVRLLELNTPVIFTLETHRDVVQYRYDARIAEYGPLATSPLIEGGITLAAGDSIMSAILDGVMPPGAKKMVVKGVDGRTSAYRHDGMTYVRTPLTLLSPGWKKSVASADGMHVYALSNAPVLLLSQNGTLMKAFLNSEGEADE